MSPIIRTEKLSHRYSVGTPFEHAALDSVDFAAERGELVGVIGHTGSGKSTLIQHLNGLLKPSEGRVLLEDRDIWESKESIRQTRFKVGLVFQYPEYQLFEETVYKDIAFGPTNMKLSKTEIDERVHEAAEFTGVGEELLEKSPFELSGGQKRRVAIAGVIAMRPEVLILDEPTAGLDPEGSRSILENVARFKAARDATVILVSHSMEDMARMADRLVVMSGGQLVMNGAPAEIFSRDEELGKMGLDVPEVTRVMRRVRELGLPVDGAVYTVEQAKEALLRLRRAGNA